jgi:Domain of unknown function (DUF3303)
MRNFYTDCRALSCRVLVPQIDEGTVMLFMAIEHFRDHDAKAIYARFRERGRLMSDGIDFVGSWVAADLGRCFQVIECDDITLLQHWAAEWSDLIELEIIPVAQGKNTTALSRYNGLGLASR